jgi:hypothetical protein
MLPFIGELLNEKILKFLRAEAKYVPVSVAAIDEAPQSVKTKAGKAKKITDNNETSGEQA